MSRRFALWYCWKSCFWSCAILEAKSYKDIFKQGNNTPFEAGSSIVICSYQFARNKANDVEVVPWDLVVIDETHRSW